jgi:hypothetical protein
MSAAPLEITVKRKDSQGNPINVKYRLSPLDQHNLGEFDRWAQDRYLDRVKANTKDLPEAMRMELLHRAFIEAANITLSSKQGSELMLTVEGMVKLFEISIRKEHPNITPEEITSIMFDSEVLNMVADKISFVNGGQDENPLRPAALERLRGKNHQKRRRVRT